MSNSGVEAFGTEVKKTSRELVAKRGEDSMPSIEGPGEVTSLLNQWELTGDDGYMATSSTCKKLPAGMYTIEKTNRGIKFSKRQVNVDGILEFPGSESQKIVDEIEMFWKRQSTFARYGYLHRRGYLLFGPPGSGKSILVQQVIQKVIERDEVVFLCNTHPEIVDYALRVFRMIEPSRRIVCVLEDLDAHINRHGEEQVLGLLDGESQITGVLNLATTNYPEHLDKRIVSRPRRFDRLVFIGHPDEETRGVYLARKLQVNGELATKWAADTDGFSFAALADLVISVECLGLSYEDTLEKLRKIMTEKQSSARFGGASAGFRLDD